MQVANEHYYTTILWNISNNYHWESFVWNDIWEIGIWEMVIKGDLPGRRLTGRLFKRLEREGTGFCEESMRGRWFEDIGESERMWSGRLQAHGGSKARSGSLNWMCMWEGLIEAGGMGWSVSDYKCEEVDRPLSTGTDARTCERSELTMAQGRGTWGAE